MNIMDYKGCIKCRLLSEPPKFSVKAPPALPNEYLEFIKATNYNLSQKLEKINFLVNNKKNKLKQHRMTTTTTTSTINAMPSTVTSIANLFILSLCTILFIFIFLLLILFLINICR